MTKGARCRAGWWLLLAAAPVAVGCADDGTRALSSAPANDATPASPAEQLAQALAEAERAFGRGDETALTAALRRIDALGAAPFDDETNELRRWRAAAAASPPMRGRPLGPGFRSGELSPGASEQIEQVFLSGERASVALSSPGAGRLTLEVQDRREEPVCSRGGKSNHCQWVPVFTERYRIRVANPGNESARYFLVIE